MKNFKIFAVSFLMIPLLTIAQEEEEVIVTANKKAETLQEIPMNISVITESAIEERGITNPEDYLRSLAGVSTPGGSNFYTFRGLNTSTSQRSSGTSTTYIDEIGGSLMSLFDVERIIWANEESKFDVPKGIFEIGLGMCGPVMMEYASNEQKERYLPPMAEGKEIWCQLFSEPSAGSDVAGLRSKAVQNGDKWIINGQKVWTSGAHFSDYGILVVRHDPNLEKHKGMTFFFVDMKSPGIEIKPIKQITGGSSFNEVYFTDVEIPDTQRLGEIGDGWKVAITTLMNERLAVGDAGGADVEDAFRWAKNQDNLGEPLLNNKAARESIEIVKGNSTKFLQFLNKFR